MVQQKSGSFRQREAERMRRFIIARQLSGGSVQNGEAPLPLNDPLLATEEADALAQSSNQGAADAPHYEQVSAAERPRTCFCGRSFSLQASLVYLSTLAHCHCRTPISVYTKLTPLSICPGWGCGDWRGHQRLVER